MLLRLLLYKENRNRMKNYRPGHVWEALDDGEFLYRLGVAIRRYDGIIQDNRENSRGIP